MYYTMYEYRYLVHVVPAGQENNNTDTVLRNYA
jgi:hypothetical protein